MGCLLNAAGQGNATTMPAEKNFQQAESKPMFPGGEDAWKMFVNRNFNNSAVIDRLPDAVREFTDSITVSFTVSTSGRIKNTVTSHCKSEVLKHEVLVLLKKSPQWIPGKKNGHAVKARSSYRFIFWVVADFSAISIETVTDPVSKM